MKKERTQSSYTTNLKNNENKPHKKKLHHKKSRLNLVSSIELLGKKYIGDFVRLFLVFFCAVALITFGCIVLNFLTSGCNTFAITKTWRAATSSIHFLTTRVFLSVLVFYYIIRLYKKYPKLLIAIGSIFLSWALISNSITRNSWLNKHSRHSRHSYHKTVSDKKSDSWPYFTSVNKPTELKEQTTKNQTPPPPPPSEEEVDFGIFAHSIVGSKPETKEENIEEDSQSPEELSEWALAVKKLDEEEEAKKKRKRGSKQEEEEETSQDVGFWGKFR